MKHLKAIISAVFAVSFSLSEAQASGFVHGPSNHGGSLPVWNLPYSKIPSETSRRINLILRFQGIEASPEFDETEDWQLDSESKIDAYILSILAQSLPNDFLEKHREAFRSLEARMDEKSPVSLQGEDLRFGTKMLGKLRYARRKAQDIVAPLVRDRVATVEAYSAHADANPELLKSAFRELERFAFFKSPPSGHAVPSLETVVSWAKLKAFLPFIGENVPSTPDSPLKTAPGIDPYTGPLPRNPSSDSLNQGIRLSWRHLIENDPGIENLAAVLKPSVRKKAKTLVVVFKKRFSRGKPPLIVLVDLDTLRVRLENSAEGSPYTGPKIVRKKRTPAADLLAIRLAWDSLLRHEPRLRPLAPSLSYRVRWFEEPQSAPRARVVFLSKTGTPSDPGFIRREIDVHLDSLDISHAVLDAGR